MAYAEGTTVPVERSRAEIERIVMKFGATQFGSAFKEGAACVQFVARGRAIRFLLTLPQPTDKKFVVDGRNSVRPIAKRQLACEQEHRRLWRALGLAVKAKLEAVESGISTFEREFLAYMVQADGFTIGDKIIPQLDTLPAGQGPMLALLGGGS